MNDTMIFVVGLGVMGIVMASAFIALLASDHPEKPRTVTESLRPNPASGDISAMRVEQVGIQPARS